ncbi:hypothetical protein WAK64_12855 [Bacillus spongiae]|uniref:Uncharacterized protein n=1 Tax=Bacillus spongiae TaxID=2683610 RepID=A0ABU8HF03_9BACI
MRDKQDIYKVDEELENFPLLQDFSVEFPSDEEMFHTIEELRQYVPQQQENTSINQLSRLIKLSASELFHIEKSFWSANLVFFVIGLLLAITNNSNPYFTIMLLSPVPFLIGLLQIFKGRDENVLELELTFKYTAQQQMLAKMVVIGVYNFILNIILITLLSLFGEGQLIVSKMLLYWIIPFSLVASIGLWVTQKVKGPIAVPSLVISWTAFTFIYMMNEGAISYFETKPFIFYVITFVLSILFFIQQVKKMKNSRFIDISQL